MTVKKKTFEQALNRLDEILNEIEKSDLPLDDLIKFYKEGLDLANFCSNKLSEAKLLVEQAEIK